MGKLSQIYVKKIRMIKQMKRKVWTNNKMGSQVLIKAKVQDIWKNFLLPIQIKEKKENCGKGREKLTLFLLIDKVVSKMKNMSKGKR